MITKDLLDGALLRIKCFYEVERFGHPSKFKIRIKFKVQEHDFLHNPLSSGRYTIGFDGFNLNPFPLLTKLILILYLFYNLYLIKLDVISLPSGQGK